MVRSIRALLCVALLALPCAALAQEKPPEAPAAQPAAPQQPQERSFTVTFPASRWRIIGAGLAELPLKHSADVMNDLNRQIDEQMKAGAAAGGAPDKKPEPAVDAAKPRRK